MIANESVVARLQKKYACYSANDFISHDEFIAALVADLREAEKNAAYQADRERLNAAAAALNTSLFHLQAHNILYFVLGPRILYPLTFSGFLMMGLALGYQDLNFQNDTVLTVFSIGCVAALGLYSAAYYVRVALHQAWSKDVEDTKKDYHEKLNAFLGNHLKLQQDIALTNLINEGVQYTRSNWYGYSENDGPAELKKIGFREAALHGQKETPAEIVDHENRKKVSLSWTILLNLGGLICGVFFAGMIHEWRRSVRQKQHQRDDFRDWLEDHFETNASQNNHHDFLGSELAILGVIGLAILAFASIALHCYQKNTTQMMRLSTAGPDQTTPVLRARLPSP